MMFAPSKQFLPKVGRSKQKERRRRRKTRVALESLESRLLLAFSADVFADINQFGVSANVDSMVEFDGRAFFSADDGQTGSELWVSDGSAGGTELFADLLPGTDGSQPGELTVIGTELFFTARDDAGEFDLWKTDGTTSGTVMVFDANAAGVYLPERLTASGGKLFFAAYQIDLDLGNAIDENTGTELWVHDPVTSGTTLVLDINPDDSVYSGPQELTDHNGVLFFSTYDSGYENRELWRSDGTAGGTVMVADIAGAMVSDGMGGMVQDDTYSSDPTDLTSVGTNLFFSADDPETGRELYVYDGTDVTLLEINAGTSWSNPQELVAFGGQVYFSATDGSAARSLFSSNGSTFAEITGGTVIENPKELTVVGSHLFFVASEAAVGSELWRTDGTTNTLVEDIVSGVASSNPSQLTEAGGRLYFSADEPTTFGRELWRSEGAFDASTTDRLINSRTGVDLGGSPQDGSPEGLIEIGTTLFFTTLDDNADRELWTSNDIGTTAALLNINPSTKDADVEQVVVDGTDIYFVADDGINGEAVWVADTTTPGSVTMIDMTPGTSAESIRGLSVQNGEVWFYNNLGGASSNGAIYRTTGTLAGTVEVAEQTPIVAGVSENDLFTTFGGQVYFVSEDVAGVELWRSDVAGTSVSLFADIFTGLNGNGGANSSDPSELTVFNGVLYFSAVDAVNGRELWQTDGTTATLAHDIFVGTASSEPRELTVSGSHLFFSATNGTDDTLGQIGRELWSLSATNVLTGFDIDTTLSGTVNDDSDPINLTDVNGTLYFAADLDNGEIDKEPYSADGVNAPIPVRTSTNVQIGDGQGAKPSGFTELGGMVYFAATGTGTGRELWRTTATPSGTFTPAEQVSDTVGAESASPTEIVAATGRIFFAGTDENTGDNELWTAGGVLTSGAAQVLDLFPGVFKGSDPTDMVEVGGKVYFVAEDAQSGRELFVLNDISPSAEVVINDGATSRSQITSVKVTFDALLDLEPSDFQITNIDTSAAVTNLQVDISQESSTTIAVITFGSGGVSVVDRLGVGVLGNSLADGNYRLDVLAADVVDPTTPGPGLAADLVFGGQLKAAIPNDNFYRLYGDVDADGDADFTDFANDFLPGFGTEEGQAAFRSSLDFEGDGDQDFTDFAIGFLPNFGTTRL